MEEYYLDEIPLVIAQWNALHRYDEEQEDEVGAMEFLGEGGEILG